MQLDSEISIDQDSDADRFFRVLMVLILCPKKALQNDINKLKDGVFDIDAAENSIDEQCDLIDSFCANKKNPGVMEARMFTPAKKRPVKRQAESSARQNIPVPKPRSKKLKEENISQNSTESSIPTRVLRSRTVLTASTSSINSTGTTVMENSGYARTLTKKNSNARQVKAVTTPVRANKPDDKVKLTPIQKKNKLLEAKRAETLQKIEEKERRIEKNKAEKQKMDLLKKAQSQMNKTPRQYGGLRTPTAQKQMPKRDLNATPVSSAHSSMSNSRSQPKLTNTTKQPIVKKENVKPIAKPIPKPIAKPAPKPIKKTTKAAAPIAPKEKVLPMIERHIEREIEPMRPPIVEIKSPFKVDPIRSIELSPICNDKDQPISNNKIVDISVLKNINPFVTSFHGEKSFAASTLLQETINAIAANDIHHPAETQQKTRLLNNTINIDDTKENNYEITQYLGEAHLDDDQEYRNGKKIPRWARGSVFKKALEKQFTDSNVMTPYWGEMPNSIPFDAFQGFNIDARLMKRLENRDESLIWNIGNL